MDNTADTTDLSLFLAGTAHDMKNSISVLTATLEKLLARPQGVEADSAYPQMAHMLYQTKRLNDKLIQLLALYKQVGQPGYPFDMQPLALGHLVDQVIQGGQVLLASNNIALELDYDPDLIWHFDEDLIAGVIGHAINNAVHYTRDRIRLSMVVVDECLEMRVEDNGSGYPPAMLRAGVALTANSGINFLTNSTGLGLFFSSAVARMHRHRGRTGSLRLENGGAHGGACFVLILP